MVRNTLLILLLFAAFLPAQTDDNISIYGFGSWAFAKTDGNQYFWSNEDGTMDYYDFALNINATVSSKFRVNAQFYTNSYYGGDSVDIDFAFAEYAFSDAFKLRAGKVKQAFGIYGDIKRVGTIRPFFTLPTSAYDHDYFVSPGITGVAIAGTFVMQNGWAAQYDFHYGASEGNFNIRSIGLVAGYYYGTIPFQGNAEDVPVTSFIELESNDNAGGRLAVETPISGLSLIGSFATNHTIGTIRDTSITAYDTDTFTYATSVVYDAFPFSFNLEYLYADFEGIKMDYNLVWLELGYMLTESTQIVGRFENADGQSYAKQSQLITDFRAMFENDILKDHKEYAIGLNYFFNSNFVLRASIHKTEGLLWAAPPRGLASFIDEEINPDTLNLIIGVNYSF
jgi:hypothetical protein